MTYTQSYSMDIYHDPNINITFGSVATQKVLKGSKGDDRSTLPLRPWRIVTPIVFHLDLEKT